MIAPFVRRLEQNALVGPMLARFKPGSGGRSMAIGALTSLSIIVTGMALSFALQIVVARSVGKAEYGLYLYVLGWANVAVLFGKLNFDVVAPRFVGAYTARAEWGLLHGFLRRGLVLITVVSLLISGLGVAAIFLAPNLSQVERWCALVAALIAPGTALLTVTGATLQGLRRIVAAQAPNQIIRPIIFATGIGALLLFRPLWMTAFGALAANAVATFCALLLSYTLLRKATPPLARDAPPVYATREWIRVGGWLLLADVFQLMVSQQSDVLVVGTMLTKSDAGMYGAASQLANLSLVGVMAVSFVTAPQISALHASGERESLQRLLRMMSRVNLLAAFPIVLGLVILGRWLLGWFGPSFSQGYPVLIILAVSHLTIAGIGTLAGSVMSMTGRQQAASWIIGASAAIYLVLALVLTPRFGVVGTAAATLISTLTRSLTLAIYVRTRIGLSVFPIS